MNDTHMNVETDQKERPERQRCRLIMTTAKNYGLFIVGIGGSLISKRTKAEVSDYFTKIGCFKIRFSHANSRHFSLVDAVIGRGLTIPEKCIYIYIYMCVCVCVVTRVYLLTPLYEQLELI